MALPFDSDNPVRKTYFINESERSVDPADDEGKVVQLENTGQLHPDFVPTVPLNVQEFDASGTWLKPSMGTVALVEIIGAGGSGGAVKDDDQAGVGTGGSGGAYRKFLVPLSFLSAEETVTIGLGGASRVAGALNDQLNGLPGGVSWFKDVDFQANGGLGGEAVRSGSPISLPATTGGAKSDVLISESGGAGGSGSNGANANAGGSTFFAGPGGGAGATANTIDSTPNQASGLGGTAKFLGSTGGNGAGVRTSGDAIATHGYRGGGGGGAAVRSAGFSATSGKGGDGYVRVTVF